MESVYNWAKRSREELAVLRQTNEQKLERFKRRIDKVWKLFFGLPFLILLAVALEVIRRLQNDSLSDVLAALQNNDPPSDVVAASLGFLIAALIACGCLLLRTSMKSQRTADLLQNLARGEEAWEALEETLLSNAAFVLYLRDFRPESRFWKQHGDPFESSIQNYAYGLLWGEYKGASRRLERDIIEPLTRCLPVFAFLNYTDLNPSPSALRIYTTGENWYTIYHHLAQKAALIVFNLSDITENVMKEVEWVLGNDAGDRTLLVLSKKARRELQRQSAVFLNRARWILARPRVGPVRETFDHPGACLRLPQDLLGYLATTSQGTRAT